MIRISIFVILFFNCFLSLACSYENQSLNGNWEFREAGTKSLWYKASVPGSIFNDLLQAKLIPDPLLFDNETKVQDISNKEWEYRRTITLDENKRNMQHAMLVFEGLDSYVSVYLNDSLLAISDNMFLPLKTDIRKYLRQGTNTLLLRFHAAGKVTTERQLKNGKKYPGGERTFLRKAAYQFGWDWAPKLPGCGIWQGVSLQWWSDFLMSEISIAQHELTDTSGVFRLRFKTTSSRDTLFSASVFVNDSLHLKRNIKAVAGTFSHDIFIRIPNPRRWWCREYGDPYLYKISFYPAVCSVSKIEFMRGFKSLSVDRDHEAKGRGGFRILLNGKPVYIKGANYVPLSPFPGNISRLSVIKSVRKAASTGLNMLRVWGGGVYADSAFMAECDRQGIMVWHDFMFACAMVPFEGAMIPGIKNEIQYQAARLSCFTSLALFCGNNEISEGWFNWGWQKEYQLNKIDSALIWKQYTSLFHIAIPGILKSACPHIPYWESSPMTGWGRPSAYLDGDVHYWGVWWGMFPFESYRRKIGRFVSEYGFQGTPEPYLLKRMSRNKKISFSDPELKNHQKHPRGFETISDYAEQYFPSPKDFSAQWYTAAVQQAYAMEMAISSHRSKSPYNMGTMFWQWNDCWPSVSWSVLDESLKPKAAWYEVKRRYQPVHLDLTGTPGNYSFVASLSGADPLSGAFRLELVNNAGNIIFSREEKAVLQPCTSREIIRFSDPLVMKTLDTGLHHVRLYFLQDNLPVTQSTRLLCRPRYLKLSNPSVAVKSELVRGVYHLEISSRSFAPWLAISASVPGEFSDNYFHLDADEKRIIMFTPDAASLKMPLFEVRSLYDVSDHTPAPGY
jgi:beta-mannosidase